MTKTTPPKTPVAQRRVDAEQVEHTPVERFLTVDQAAWAAQVSPRHIRRLIARGDLVADRFGRAVRITPANLKACAVARRA